MNSISTAVVAFMDLMEAEVREVRRAIFRLGLSLALLMLCGVCALSGVAVLMLAWFYFLEPLVGQAPAAFLTALVLLAGAGGLLWTARRLATK